MVQSLSPEVRESHLKQSAQHAIQGLGSLVDRSRRLVLPDRGERIPETRQSRSVSARATATDRPIWASRAAVVLPRLLFGICALLLVLAIGLFAFRSLYSDRIYPAVVVGDVEVGGLTQDEALGKLNERATTLDQHGVTFTYGGKTWTPTLTELGANIQVDDALAEAHQFGRTGDAVDRLTFTGEILQNDQAIPLRSTFDTAKLNTWFDQVDKDINNFAVDAGLVVSGTDVSITPDATGIVIDRPAATALILQSLKDFQPVNREIPTQADQPKILAADLEPAREHLASSLGEHIRVDFEDSSWRIEPSTLSQYLVVSQSFADGKVSVDISMDDVALTKFLREEYAEKVNRSPVNATVGWKDGTGLIATSESADGVTLKPGEFAAAVSASFLGDHERVEVPVIVTKPQIDPDNLAALKIDGLIGRGDSNFDGSSDSRATNIGVGVQLLNGTLIGPGKDFSFNGAIGEITAEKGYVESAVVVAERVGKDVGGGICQVSTTTFRAALRAGMAIGEWNPHTYRIKSYEYDGWGPGFDASILQEGSDPELWGDFTFTNNTDGYILVQSWTDYPYVVVEIYGHQDGRTAETYDHYVSDPVPNPVDTEFVNGDLEPGTIEQTEWPLDGLETSFMYTTKDKDGNILTERYFPTVFKGRGNTWQVSPDMAGESPAA